MKIIFQFFSDNKIQFDRFLIICFVAKCNLFSYVLFVELGIISLIRFVTLIFYADRVAILID